MEAASNELSPLLLKTSERSGCDRYTDIIKICDKHIYEQSNIIQNIINICSELTGWTGYENYSNKIITLCEELLSETHNSSNLVITLCYGTTNLNIAPSNVGKKTETQSESIPKSTEMPPSTSSAVSIKVESDVIENDIAEDTVYNTGTENSVDDNNTNIDSLSKVDVKDTEFGSEPISVNNDINSTAYNQNDTCHTKSLKTSDFVSFDDIESLNDELEDPISQSDSDSDWEPEPKTTKKPKEKTAIATINSKKGKIIQKIAEDDEQVEFACKLCPCKCKSEESIKKHYETIHYTERTKIACDICKLSYSGKKGLLAHKANVHSTAKRCHKCDMCSYSARTLYNLKKHKLIHSSIRKYQCEICGASFKLRQALFRHNKGTHTVACNHFCQFCPKQFNARDKLLKHEKTHSEKYDYPCKICGRKIRQSWNLKAHMRTHTGDKPYTCERCGQGFAHNVTRKKHMMTCFGIKPGPQN